MGLASVLLGILAIIVAIGGIVATPVYILGAVLSFGAPIIALVGIVLGGVSYSRAKNDGGETGLSIAGIITSVLGFILGFLVAITCGMCNSMCTAGAMSGGTRGHDPLIVWDAGPGAFGVDPFQIPDPNDPGLVPVPPLDPSAPPPAFPAPPAGGQPADPSEPATDPSEPAADPSEPPSAAP